MGNAIVVNEINSREAGENYGTVLIGVGETKENYIVARFTVQNRTWKMQDFDILYSIAKESIKIGAGSRQNGATVAGMNPDSSFASSKMKVSQLLDIVKGASEISSVLSEDTAK